MSAYPHCVISMNHLPSRTIFPAHMCTMVAIAQLVEHQIVVLRVAGSSPVSHPTFFLVNKLFLSKIHYHSGYIWSIRRLMCLFSTASSRTIGLWER